MECIVFSIMPISSPNPMFYHLLEKTHRDDSNKWSNIGFGEEITQVESIEFNFTHLIWSSEYYHTDISVAEQLVVFFLLFCFNSIYITIRFVYLYNAEYVLNVQVLLSKFCSVLIVFSNNCRKFLFSLKHRYKVITSDISAIH